MATSKKDDAGQAEVQKVADEAESQGFLGTRTDPTPLDNYTVSGVVAGKPTPETDATAAAEALVLAKQVEQQFDGPSAQK